MPSTKVQQLIALLTELRTDANACAWTKAQTLQSLAPQTIDESYELAEAIESNDEHAVRQELADLLYHFLFYAQISEEQYHFNLDDIAQTTIDKHHQRLPPAADRKHYNAEQTNAYWDKKKAEKLAAQQSILDGIAVNLPALTRSIKLQNRAASVGFDWPNVSFVFEKINEELLEVQHEINTNAAIEKIEEEVGDLLFAVSNLARHLKIDPETALRKGNRKFTHRFQAMEKLAAEQNKTLKDLSLEEMEVLWQQIKKLRST